MRKPEKLKPGMLLAGVDICLPEYNKCIEWYNKCWEDREKWHRERYEFPLLKIVPAGSEFVNNPERCFEYIKEKIETGSQAKKDVVKLRRKVFEKE